MTLVVPIKDGNHDYKLKIFVFDRLSYLDSIQTVNEVDINIADITCICNSYDIILMSNESSLTIIHGHFPDLPHIIYMQNIAKILSDGSNKFVIITHDNNVYVLHTKASHTGHSNDYILLNVTAYTCPNIIDFYYTRNMNNLLYSNGTSGYITFLTSTSRLILLQIDPFSTNIIKEFDIKISIYPQIITGNKPNNIPYTNPKKIIVSYNTIVNYVTYVILGDDDNLYAIFVDILNIGQYEQKNLNLKMSFQNIFCGPVDYTYGAIKHYIYAITNDNDMHILYINTSNMNSIKINAKFLYKIKDNNSNLLINSNKFISHFYDDNSIYYITNASRFMALQNLLKIVSPKIITMRVQHIADIGYANEIDMSIFQLTNSTHVKSSRNISTTKNDDISNNQTIKQ